MHVLKRYIKRLNYSSTILYFVVMRVFKKKKNIRHKITDQEITFTKVAYEFVGM